jgi:hypothetical protein
MKTPIYDRESLRHGTSSEALPSQNTAQQLVPDFVAEAYLNLVLENFREDEAE